MKIGIYTKWPLVNTYCVIGEAHYSISLCAELSKINGVKSAKYYDCNNYPDDNLDVIIHMNDTAPMSKAKKNVLYLQNGYGEGMDQALNRLRPLGYDGYIFISKKLLSLHKKQGYKGIYLPFGADVNIFNPKDKSIKYDFEVSYVGNDIKGIHRTTQFLLLPSQKYNFGLFGRWNQEYFSNITKGIIDYKELAFLYSSSKININFTMDDQVNWGAMTDRPFQIMACKGFLISDYIPEIDKNLKKCLITSTGDQDLIEKIDYYLSRPKERKEIAELGYQYVLKHATLQAKAKTLYNFLQSII